VPPQIARMNAEDLLASVFPDQVACAENLVGEIEVPDHPLVKQTIATASKRRWTSTASSAAARIESGAIASSRAI
jgi:ATP-dependent Lhr-like helicase